MDFLSESLIGSCFRNNTNYLDEFRKLIDKILLGLFNSFEIFSDADLCQVDVLTRVCVVTTFGNKLSKLFISFLEIGHFQAPGIKDR